MKIALITPIDMLDLAGLTDYHLVLPEYLSNERYRRFYSDPGIGFKILDNGAAEGYAADHHELHEWAIATRADEVVVPDALGDVDRTIELARAFEPHVRKGEFRYVGVAQGRSVSEILKCINFYRHCGWIDTLALPRVLNKIHKAQRFSLIEPLVKEYHFDAIHCLGASSWIREVLAIDELGVVRGMDTSLPVVMGLAGRSLRDPYVARSPGFFDAVVDRNSLTWKVVYDNVRTYLEWANCPITGLEEAPKG